MSIGRNDPCPCNSGKKYKQCCMQSRTEAAPVMLNALMQQAMAHFQAGRYPQARGLAEQLARLSSGHAEARHLLGLIAGRQGDHDGAVGLLRQALALAPTVYMHCHLAGELAALHRPEEAVSAYRQALAMQPDFLQAAIPLAQLFENAGRPADAADTWRDILARHPDKAALHARLGAALEKIDKPAAAADSYRRALALEPARPDLLNNLGLVQQTLGHLNEALASFREALRLQPQNAVIHSNLLLNLQYQPDVSPEVLFIEHRAFAEQFESPVQSVWPDHAGRAVSPSGRLRLGYVSADLHTHSVAYFIEPILASHDKSRFEIVCYYNFPAEDSVTQRLKAYADVWVPCHGLNDEQLAARIATDRIDILVDLSGHTAGNRLPVFARKPAPVQVTWLGYPGTTGLSAMDYRLTDESLDPAGMTEAQHTETLLRLPLCATFQPLADSPPLNPLPVLSGKPLVLACLNAAFKINPAVIRLWARILDALPEAVLMIGNATEDDTRQTMLARFRDNGIDPARLRLQPRLPIRDFLALHHEIDLALDPFPYGGGTTTNHSLWMGVPVVTLAGRTTAARHGAHNLTAAGLPEFITDTPDAYVELTLALARDLPRLAAIRQSLRERILSQPQRTPEQLTRNLEAAYRRMWDAREPS